MECGRCHQHISSTQHLCQCGNVLKPVLELTLIDALTDEQVPKRLIIANIATLGRLKTNICINSTTLSSYHCTFRTDGKRWFVRDIISTEGTYVNSRDVRSVGELQLKNGDKLQIGYLIYSVTIIEPQS